MRTILLFCLPVCLLALPAADTTITGIPDGDALTPRTEDKTLKVYLSNMKRLSLSSHSVITQSRLCQPLHSERLPPLKAVAKMTTADR